MFDYVTLRDTTVNGLLENFGKTATMFQNVAVPGANPWDSEITTETSAEVTVVQTEFSKADISLSLVEAGDVKFLMSTNGVDFDPSLSDRIQTGADVYQITQVEPLQPGSTVMLWTIYARK